MENARPNRPFSLPAALLALLLAACSAVPTQAEHTYPPGIGIHDIIVVATRAMEETHFTNRHGGEGVLPSRPDSAFGYVQGTLEARDATGVVRHYELTVHVSRQPDTSLPVKMTIQAQGAEALAGEAGVHLAEFRRVFDRMMAEQRFRPARRGAEPPGAGR